MISVKTVVAALCVLFVARSLAAGCFDGWWEIGSYEITVNDPVRWYRSTFKAEVHYPSNAGSCTFPMVVFSHSYMLGAGYFFRTLELSPYPCITNFLSTGVTTIYGQPWFPWGLYLSIWTIWRMTLLVSALCPHVCITNSLSEEPIEAGKDMAATRNRLLSDNVDDPSSPVYGKLNGIVGAMGHSFGAAASIVATSSPNVLAEYNATWDMVLPMAPPDFTDVVDDSIVTIPALMMGATKDCICPPDTNVDRVFSRSTSTCRTLIDIVNGTHCKFCDLAPVFEDACIAVEDKFSTI
ncbi:hypothetical protein Pelo_11348 [Pelomyxa schiedti]|nr:hypothetical protein Pelo_11348 [Pelomyxa schiedti]